VSTNDTVTERYELASPEFVDAFREYMQGRFADKDFDGVSFNYSWIGTGAPAHLCKEGSDIAGFHWRLRDGKCEIGQYPLPEDENDFYMKAPYDLLRILLDMDDATGAAYMANEMQPLLDDGRIALVWKDDAMLPVIARYIIIADWRNGFFSQHIA
jgi:hypothetical protein